MKTAYRTNAKPPYRTNAKPPEPLMLFKKRHPRLWSMILWATGIVDLTVGTGALWLLFPGLYYLGNWFNSLVLHWNITPQIFAYHDPPEDYSRVYVAKWGIGLALLLLSPTLYFPLLKLPKVIGRFFIDREGLKDE